MSTMNEKTLTWTNAHALGFKKLSVQMEIPERGLVSFASLGCSPMLGVRHVPQPRDCLGGGGWRRWWAVVGRAELGVFDHFCPALVAPFGTKSPTSAKDTVEPQASH